MSVTILIDGGYWLPKNLNGPSHVFESNPCSRNAIYNFSRNGIIFKLSILIIHIGFEFIKIIHFTDNVQVTPRNMNPDRYCSYKDRFIVLQDVKTVF